MKKIPQRTCIGCNEKKGKKDLIRIVKTNQKEISIDITGKKEGRGAYICNNEQCLEKAIKNKKLERTLDIKINDEIYINLRNMINGGEYIG